jgi:TonB-linked SusC/RagA family outer membrane protein
MKYMRNNKFKFRKIPFLLMLLLIFSAVVMAQGKRTITGVVTDTNGEPIVGANVVLQNNHSIGAITDIDGNFRLSLPQEAKALVISFIGMREKVIRITDKVDKIKVVLEDDSQALEEVVVVGYGQQKKKSLVGSITQTDSRTLERAGGVTSLGQALTGNLPGVITYTSTGMPGAEDPKIIIRAQSSWNNSDPLVLVDGVERPMSTVDISSVESISVLKDASATAVYGVKGANGVILITTKRGKEGKANIQIKANATMKTVSKLPEKYDAYDTFIIKNRTLERELGLSPELWGDYKPMGIIDKYRHPANATEWDRYPNVDWADVLFKDYAMSYKASVNVSGGTKWVKYFAAVDFTSEGDMFREFENNRGYTSGYGYNRINARSNLDFSLTKTTTLSVNLFGSNGVRQLPFGASDSDNSYWKSAYRTAPDAMRPIYSNGVLGYYKPSTFDVPNSVATLATSGIEKKTNTQINTDFTLNQSLDMLTKGLSVKGTVSFDNTFVEEKRGIQDTEGPQNMWVDPVSGVIYYKNEVDGGTQLDFSDGIDWVSKAGNVDPKATYRKLYYQLQLNYGRQFGKHDVGAMALFSREKYAKGNEFYHFREDWAFRATYNYAQRYFIEINGAYNGSEKFGPNNRFAFFPSFSLGWMISEEKFMKGLKFLDMLKLRGSWGRIGDDNVGGRWLYQDSWGYQSSNTYLGLIPTATPYSYYRITSLGNENISWETVEKRNIGIDYSFFKGLIAGSVDIFSDKRKDILVGGSSRSIPSFFGATAPTANLGSTKSHGYELELRLNHVFANKMRLWANTNYTHAVNEVIFRDDPVLRDAHRKAAGHAIGQTNSYINNGIYTTWDEILGSTERESYNGNKLPGEYNIIDFNADGIINDDDQAPYQYSGVPQNTYSATVGFEWKGFSASVQFYGVSNVTREVTFPTFHTQSNVAYVEDNVWSKENGGSVPMPRWSNPIKENGTRYLYDGSYVRLKNAEVAYLFKGKKIQKCGIKSLRLYLNGDNLLLWTDMPDDRESNFSGGSSMGAYPTVRRFNLGIDITL